MALKTKLRVTGQEDVVRRLNMLGEKAKEVVEPAGLAGANVILEAAQQNIHNESGFLSEHLIAKVEKVAPTKVTVDIGPDRDAYYGLMVELGHRLVSKNGAVIGNVPAHPFLRPALDESKERAEQAVAEEIRRRLGL